METDDGGSGGGGGGGRGQEINGDGSIGRHPEKRDAHALEEESKRGGEREEEEDGGCQIYDADHIPPFALNATERRAAMVRNLRPAKGTRVECPIEEWTEFLLPKGKGRRNSHRLRWEVGRDLCEELELRIPGTKQIETGGDSRFTLNHPNW